jgi:lipopolysaccharide export system ATP-binding protein
MEGLVAQGLQKWFKTRKVVDNVSLDIQRGEVVGLLGPNGAGKTTSFYMMVGLLPTEGGRIFLEGQEITALPMYQRCRLGIGYLPQESSVFRKLTVEENLLAILETQDLPGGQRRARARELLAELDLTALAPYPAYTLSGGERRRLEITRALVTNPQYLLLDEPFTGIDPIAIGDIQEIVGRLRERGIGILITDHNVRETLEITDRAHIVHDGTIFRSGTPAELAADQEVKRIYLGADFRLD